MQQPKPGERGPYLSPFCGHVASAELASRKKLLGGQGVDFPTTRKSDTLPRRKDLMPDTQLEVAETVFNRNQRREAEINEALKQEYARREVAVKNMYRLRELRLSRNEKAKTG
jgi:hypothetical protein